jgi:type IV pilus assembly protein PilC
MPTFKYIAIDENGKTIQSTSDQKDRTTLIDTLVKQKLRPVSIKETTSKKSTRLNANITLFKNKRVKSDQLVIFTRQLSAMVGAGVPLLRALSSLYNNQPANAPLKDILSKIVEDVEAGRTP